MACGPNRNGKKLPIKEIRASRSKIEKIEHGKTRNKHDEKDIAESFRLGAAGYIVKPPDYNKLVEMIRTIHAYWTLSELPRESVVSQSDCPGTLQ